MVFIFLIKYVYLIIEDFITPKICKPFIVLRIILNDQTFSFTPRETPFSVFVIFPPLQPPRTPLQID